MTTSLLSVFEPKKTRAEFTQAAVDIEQYRKLKNQLKICVKLNCHACRNLGGPQFSAHLLSGVNNVLDCCGLHHLGVNCLLSPDCVNDFFQTIAM